MNHRVSTIGEFRDLCGIRAIDQRMLALLFFTRRFSRASIEIFNIETRQSTHWCTLYGINPSDMAFNSTRDSVAIVYNWLWHPKTQGFGGIIIVRRGFLGTLFAQAILLFRTARLLAAVAGLFATRLWQRTLGVTRDASFMESIRSVRERGELAGCWPWPLSAVSYREEGSERLLVVTSRSVFDGPFCSTMRMYSQVIDGLVNCVHIAKAPRFGVLDSIDTYVLAEGFLHVPDLWPARDGPKGLGAIWRWRRIDNKMHSVVEFINLTGNAIEVTDESGENSSLVYIAIKSNDVSCVYIRAVDPHGAPHILQDISFPRRVEPAFDWHSFFLIRNADESGNTQELLHIAVESRQKSEV